MSAKLNQSLLSARAICFVFGEEDAVNNIDELIYVAHSIVEGFVYYEVNKTGHKRKLNRGGMGSNRKHIKITLS